MMPAQEPTGRRALDRERPDARLPTLIVWVFILAAVAQAVHYLPRMPETMATHFSLAGAANGWSGRTGFVVWFGVVEALFVFLAFGLPALLRRMPPGVVNIPHRELWLSPPHRERTLAELTVWMRWLGAATLGFLVITAQFIYTLNGPAAEPVLPQAFLYLVAAFVATMVWMTFLIYRRFGTRPSR
jgi:uncharacterized membrane protein